MKLPALPAEYSASLVRSDGDRSRIALRSDRRRVETEFKNGQRHIVITRGDLGVGWIWQNFDPWLETPLDLRAVAAVADPSLGLSWRAVGDIEIDGQVCRHFVGSQVESGGTVQDCFVLPNGIRRRTVTYCADGTVGLTIDTVDATVGPPPLDVFDLPAGAAVLRVGRRRSEGRGGGPGSTRQ